MGQLGIGNLVDTHLPTLVKELKDVEIVQADGGEEHSIALSKDGKVYVWGQNEECQMGLGNLWDDYRRAIREDETKTQKNLNFIRFFKRPEEHDMLPEGIKVSKVFAGKHYTMALDESKNRLYSWGLGENCVLGTLDDENVPTPHEVNPKMF